MTYILKHVHIAADDVANDQDAAEFLAEVLNALAANGLHEAHESFTEDFRNKLDLDGREIFKTLFAAVDYVEDPGGED